MSGTVTPVPVQGAYFWDNTPTVASALDLQTATTTAAQQLLAGTALVSASNATLSTATAAGSSLAVSSVGSSTPRALTARFAEKVNPLDYGCDFQTTDDTAGWAATVGRIQGLFNEGVNSIILELPAGISLCSTSLEFTLTGTQALTIFGSGAGSSLVVFTGAVTGGLHVTAGPGCLVDIHDASLVLATSAAQGTFTGLSVVYPSSATARSCSIRDMKVYSNAGNYWLVACKVVCGSSAIIEGNWFCGDSFTQGTGLIVAGLVAPAYGIDYKINNNVVQNVGIGIDVQGSVQGVFMSNSEVLGCTTAFNWNTTATGCEYATISNCHLASTTTGVYSNVNIVKLSNILFLAETVGANYTAVQLVSSGFHSVADCQVQGTFSGGTQIGVLLTSAASGGPCQFCTIADNLFEAITSYAVQLDGPQTLYNTVSGNNTINGGTIGLTNGASATSNMVVANNYDGVADINSASGTVMINKPVAILGGLTVSGNQSDGMGLLPESPGTQQIGGGGQDWATVFSRGFVMTHGTGSSIGQAGCTMSCDQGGYAQFNGICDPVLQVSGLLSNASTGARAFAANGRKPSEAAGAGTGVSVFFDGTHWISVCSGTAVTS